MRFCPTCGLRVDSGIGFCPEDGTATEPLPEESTVDPLLGRVVDGRYRIEEQIGEGGMGVVYMAIHTVLNKKLALKVLRGDMSKNTETVQRFIQEAQAASAIGHQNIIDISDFGRLPDGSAYFVMEHLEGQALTDLIARGGSVPMQDAIGILIQMASALGAAHTRGIVHRDLKPDNVFLIRRGETECFVKVLDFGIAKVGGAGSKLTKTGMVFGTPQYMSPEQAAGQSVDARTDIYALGVIMYEMFTGRVPFDADTFMGILSKHMFEPPAPPSESNPLLGALEDVILKALAKKPEQRYSSTEELLADLRSFSVTGSVRLGGNSDRPMGLADALEPPSRTEANLVPAGLRPSRLPALLILAAAVLGVLAVGALGFALLGPRFGGEDPVAGQSGEGSLPTAGAGNEGPAPDLSPDAGPLEVPPELDPRGRDAAAAEPAEDKTEDRAVQVIVSVVSVPAGAQVLDDGVVLGNAPLDVAVVGEAQTRELELRLPGYRSERVSVSVTSRSPKRVRLRRERGQPRPRNQPAAMQTAMQTMQPTTMMDTPMGGALLPGSEVVNPWALK